MDREIRKLKKVAKKEVKGLGELEKQDKKRDKVCAMGAKVMAKHKK